MATELDERLSICSVQSSPNLLQGSGDYCDCFAEVDDDYFAKVDRLTNPAAGLAGLTVCNPSRPQDIPGDFWSRQDRNRNAMFRLFNWIFSSAGRLHYRQLIWEREGH